MPCLYSAVVALWPPLSTHSFSMSSKTISPFRTVLTITVGFLVVFIIIKQLWALYAALSVGLIGVFSTFLSQQIDFIWTKLSWLLSLIVPNIILTLIFYFFLFPISLLARIFRKNDPMSLKNNRTSLFIESKKTFEPTSFERSF